jgi:hypothetical protein
MPNTTGFHARLLFPFVFKQTLPTVLSEYIRSFLETYECLEADFIEQGVERTSRKAVVHVLHTLGHVPAKLLDDRVVYETGTIDPHSVQYVWSTDAKKTVRLAAQHGLLDVALVNTIKYTRSRMPPMLESKVMFQDRCIRRRVTYIIPWMCSKKHWTRFSAWENEKILCRYPFCESIWRRSFHRHLQSVLVPKPTNVCCRIHQVIPSGISLCKATDLIRNIIVRQSPDPYQLSVACYDIMTDQLGSLLISGNSIHTIEPVG